MEIRTRKARQCRDCFVMFAVPEDDSYTAFCRRCIDRGPEVLFELPLGFRLRLMLRKFKKK